MTLHEAVAEATDIIQDGLLACEEECVKRTLASFGGAWEGVRVERNVAGVLVRDVTIKRHGEVVGRWMVSLVPKGGQLVTLAVPA